MEKNFIFNLKMKDINKLINSSKSELKIDLEKNKNKRNLVSFNKNKIINSASKTINL